MHEAMLFQKLENARVRCRICQWYCSIAPGKAGVCRMYLNRDGILYSTGYGRVSAVAVDPIEKKPLFHFFPGTKVFSLGGWGCNFHCPGCQNWEIACPVGDEPWRASRELSPETAVEEASKSGCGGIAWTYNEPTMYFEYTLDMARLARQKDLYTVYVTNGYMSVEALDTLGPYLDAWRVDVKGFTEAFYRRIAKITRWRGILEVAERARKKWGMHVEVVTNIVPTLNDDDSQIAGIARWIHDSLGEMTPWHITRFHPQRLLMEYPATPIATLERAYDIGRKAGLKFVYLGNVPGHRSENTFCHSCGKIVVERHGYDTKVVGMVDSKCKFCGTGLDFRGAKSRGGVQRDT